MVRSVVWTAEAQDDFNRITFYLKEEWGIQSAKKFADNVFIRLEKLVEMPSIAAFTQVGNQMYKLDKKNVLFFRVEDDAIILLSIYPYKKNIYKSKYY